MHSQQVTRDRQRQQVSVDIEQVSPELETGRQQVSSPEREETRAEAGFSPFCSIFSQKTLK